MNLAEAAVAGVVAGVVVVTVPIARRYLGGIRARLNDGLMCDCPGCDRKWRIIRRSWRRHYWLPLPAKALRLVLGARPRLIEPCMSDLPLRYVGGCSDGHVVDPFADPMQRQVWGRLLGAGECWEKREEAEFAHKYELDEEAMTMVFRGMEYLPDDWKVAGSHD